MRGIFHLPSLSKIKKKKMPTVLFFLTLYNQPSAGVISMEDKSSAEDVGSRGHQYG